MKRAAAKSKNPDFDRTLSNFVRKQQQSGHEVKDEDIMDQAKLFARASGSGSQQDGLLNSLTSSWLQKFKQKHGLGGGGGRLIRRASEANIPDSARMSTVRRPSVKKSKRKNAAAGPPKQAVLAPKEPTPPIMSTTGLGIGIISPTSPTGQMSPLSETKSEEEAEDAHTSDPFDLDFNYRSAASQSANDLSTDNMASSFSGALSPAGTLAFSPDPNTFNVEQTIDPRNGAVSSSDFQHLHREKRSNTFPSLNIDAATTATRTNTDSPVSSMSQQHPGLTTLESPDQDLSGSNPFTLDTTLGSPPKLRRSGSNSSIAAARSATATPAPNSAVTTSSMAASASLESLSSIMSSPPVSPSQEDARRAANTLLSYMQSVNTHGGQGQQFEHGEYMALVQLTKKLQVHQLQMQQQQQQQAQVQHRPSIGGLSRIPEGDTEMIQAPEIVMETS